MDSSRGRAKDAMRAAYTLVFGRSERSVSAPPERADALDHPRYLRRGRRPSSSGFGEAFASTGAERTWVLEHRSAAETKPKPEIGGRPGPLRYRRCALGTLIEKFLNPRVHLSPYPVQNGSGSLEDETRDQAWLEAIVALPLNMFYSTGIATYVWLLSNGKPEHRRGKVQPIDATKWFKPLRKN